MRFIYFLFSLTALQGDTLLQSLIESAQNNDQIQALQYQSDSANLGYESVKRSYFPRLDAFGNASYINNTGGFDAKESYMYGLKAEVVVFDGFKRDKALEQSKALEKSAKTTLLGTKKEVSLSVIHKYIQIQNTSDEISTLNTMREQLEAQLIRLEKFKTAGLATDDAIMRIRSEISITRYNLENLVYQYEQQISALGLISNQKISNLESFSIAIPNHIEPKELDKITSMKLSRDAKLSEAQQHDSNLYPTLKIEDQYTFYDYSKDDPIANMRVSNQNKIMASLSMNIIDFSASSYIKEALLAQVQAQNTQLSYTQKEADENLRLAKRNIERSQMLIDASQQTFDAANQTFQTVKRKYEARIVDYVTYLDALYALSNATTGLKRSQRDIFYAYATYYFNAGYDPKEFIK